MEKGKKSSWETGNYITVGNSTFKFFFFFPVLFSNGNGSFAGGRVTLKEVGSILQGLKWGQWPWTGGEGDGTEVRSCLKRQAFLTLREVLCPSHKCQEETAWTRRVRAPLKGRNTSPACQGSNSGQRKIEGARKTLALQSLSKATHHPGSNARATEPCSCPLPGSHPVETAFFFGLQHNFSRRGLISVYWETATHLVIVVCPSW